ncbi:hypothetical protein [Mycolicibacterium mageritense]|uniref:Uncharacterized protein n=1 Tax=Mycolicibacterium mageritense TaxID=53462 RepID=A0AAI8TWF7_MYCME|nr:hypothetical protein [Mycolicibacterium mageritense]BDY29780.1 hypothetical protein hbim_03720 [Mycolicibacterium mageritense]
MAIDAKSAINKVLNEASDDVKQVVAEVLKIESNYIHMALPRGVHDDIQELIERVIK